MDCGLILACSLFQQMKMLGMRAWPFYIEEAAAEQIDRFCPLPLSDATRAISSFPRLD